jgi:hypothetical protein
LQPTLVHASASLRPAKPQRSRPGLPAHCNTRLFPGTRFLYRISPAMGQCRSARKRQPESGLWRLLRAVCAGRLKSLMERHPTGVMNASLQPCMPLCICGRHWYENKNNFIQTAKSFIAD